MKKKYNLIINNKDMADKFMLVRVFLIILACATLYILISRYTQKQKVYQSEKFYEDMSSILPLVQNGGISQNSPAVQPSEPITNEDYRAVEFSGQQLPNDCFPKDRLTADDLLPQDAANSRWAQVNPAGQGDVKDQNFLQSGYHVGLNTTLGNKRNGNLQVRSEPINSQKVVSPWLQSTIVPDTQRRPLEIGEDCDEK
jgi:hypothetical protein